MVEGHSQPALVDSGSPALVEANQVNIVYRRKDVLRFIQAALESSLSEISEGRHANARS